MEHPTDPHDHDELFMFTDSVVDEYGQTKADASFNARWFNEYFEDAGSLAAKPKREDLGDGRVLDVATGKVFYKFPTIRQADGSLPPQPKQDGSNLRPTVVFNPDADVHEYAGKFLGHLNQPLTPEEMARIKEARRRRDQQLYEELERMREAGERAKAAEEKREQARQQNTSSPGGLFGRLFGRLIE